MVSEQPLRNSGTLPRRPKRPAEIRPRAAAHCLAWHGNKHHHRCRYLRSCFRFHHQPLHRLLPGGPGNVQADLYAGRQPQGRPHQSDTAKLRASHFKQYESQHRPFSRGRYHRGISGRETRSRLSDYLRVAGVPAQYGHHFHHYPVRHRHGILQADPECGALL